MFDLFVTTTSGRTFKTLRSPYSSREESAQTVRVVLADQGRSARQFAEQVATAPLGETVTHEPSGITFRTEEFPS